ncbi:ComEC/Rec2 family competence protein [Arthrobacter cavernae]|uniref:ComEC/Rec2 family competence protein n=1 Tax=Arthrobacter cavernae TaxID=2817681 RepID=A0A939HJH0_9MICC|nr:ComEC/Rec2 family competence protein [Arthrobacter cavernae]MBO1268418.1 ComEC/Rec2 family competence protein [Arthrobacter cavernae]
MALIGERRPVPEGSPAGSGAARRRADLRLVPAALCPWAVAVAGAFLPAFWTLLLSAGLALAAVLLLARRRKMPCRSIPATVGLACILGVVVGAHSALSGSQRDGALADAVAEGDGVVVQLLVAGEPREASLPGAAGDRERWSVPADVIEVTANSMLVRGSARIVVVGGEAWRHTAPGQRIRTTGKLKPAKPGQPEAGILSASSRPTVLEPGSGFLQAPGELREQFRLAAGWLPADAAGLLPGMVTGDTASLDEGLEADMKTTGMTHLTAVSGANCSLVLGGFVLLARSLRLPRPGAALLALGGLGAFVLMVGPDASVLRAAVMGAVGLAAITGGRQGRSLSFLCTAVAGLLLLDPSLGVEFGFLLSVLATLGIVLLASRIAAWLPDAVPRWLAAGIAVPLSAQLLCGPVIVALQPQFTSYALVANVAAAPLVAPVTILGTAAVPLVAVAPGLAAVPLGLAGFSAGGVAGIARFFAGLPGAALPWSEGAGGMAAMLLLSAVTVLLLWMVLHPAAVQRAVLALHALLAWLIAAFEEAVRRALRHRLGSRGPGHGAAQRPAHGRLEVCKNPPGRNQLWLLPKRRGPRVSRRIPPAGGTLRRPP